MIGICRFLCASEIGLENMGFRRSTPPPAGSQSCHLALDLGMSPIVGTRPESDCLVIQQMTDIFGSDIGGLGDLEKPHCRYSLGG